MKLTQPEPAETTNKPKLTMRIQYRESPDSPLIDLGTKDITNQLFPSQEDK